MLVLVVVMYVIVMLVIGISVKVILVTIMYVSGILVETHGSENNVDDSHVIDVVC